MSGICGIWALGGGDPDLSPILAQLERRGPDGTHRWSDGPVALGHTLLATTPEALVEVLPLTEPDSGCTITADARLDNREDLIEAVGLCAETRTIGDGELILRAYLKWGEDCPKHLLGDFAFAIWDARRHQLFCARDHMGMRQLIYHHTPGQLFAFATEAEALVTHPAVPKRINEARIADFLDDLEGIDFTSTFFKEVFRLPPAHILVVEADVLSLRRYWQLTPGPGLELDSDQAYADAFLEVFTEAVRCRMRSAGPIGSMLSGGMDSGSISAVAARLLAADGGGPLNTFSAVGLDSATCVETRTIGAATNIPGLAPHFIELLKIADHRADLMRLPDGTEPFDSHLTLIRAIYQAAHRTGVRVVLDGAGGDVILTSGNRVAHLLRLGRLFEAIREVRGEARFWGTDWPIGGILASAAWAALVPAPLRALRRTVITRYRDRRSCTEGLVAPAFADRVTLGARRARLRRHSPGGQLSKPAARARSIFHPSLVVARERYDRIAAAMAIEPRDPFLDIRLIHFCLSLPSAQLQAGGWPKIILRRAMANLLPANVIWRHGKEHLGWSFTQALFETWPGWREQLKCGRSRLDPYVADAEFDTGNHPFGKALDTEPQIKLFFLLNWIERIDPKRPITEIKSGNTV